MFASGDRGFTMTTEELNEPTDIMRDWHLGREEYVPLYNLLSQRVPTPHSSPSFQLYRPISVV